MLVATRGIAAVGPYFPFGISPDLPTFPHGAQMVSGVEEARRAVREQIGNGADQWAVSRRPPNSRACSGRGRLHSPLTRHPLGSMAMPR